MTTFLDRLLGRPEPPAKRATKAVTSLGPWSSGIPLTSLHNTPQAKAAAYLQAYRVGWFYKAGRKISGDFADLHWSVSDGDPESDDPKETVLGHPDLDTPFPALSPIDQFQRLMERPNPWQTGRVLRQRTCIRTDFGGLGIWWLENGDMGLPTAIYGISPARMWPSYGTNGQLIGWVLDKDKPSGGVPFSAREILAFSAGGPDDDPFGVSVVEAVYAQVPLTDLMARHTADVLTTGGRLAGMMWPKERALSEDEFQDAQRAWRNVASDPNAAKRMLIFPEPMEWAAGASTPAEIGIPELALLNRDEILTAFPISPYQLGVPAPGGLNSGEVRREDRRDYWEGTIHPRVEAFKEVVQTGLLSRYEAAMGRTFDFDLAEPNLDDASGLLEKVAALRALASAGFDQREAVKSVGLDYIKFGGIPAPDPALAVTVNDSNRQDASQTSTTVIDKKPAPVAKAMKARDDIQAFATPLVRGFLNSQRERTVERIRATFPAAKGRREGWATKDDREWWVVAEEDAALRQVLSTVYLEAGRSSLQVVAEGLGRIVPGKTVQRIVDDLDRYGGERIKDINARTLQRITLELAEGARRGYTIGQLIDGVPAEGFKGVVNVGLDNGIGVWGDARAETIARTETALSYNRAALGGYKEFRVARVLAYDGDGDPECAARNGREFSIDDAFSIADHPNGTLDWAPVDTGKAWDDHEPMYAMADAIKALAQREPDTNVFNIPPTTVNVACSQESSR